MPSFENFGGHEFSFIKPLNLFSRNKNLNLIYLLPKLNKLKLKNKNYKIIFFSKEFKFIIKLISILANYLIIKKFFEKNLKNKDIIYLDGYSLYFLISFIFFYYTSNQKKIKLILWLRYPITNSIKNNILKFFLYKICNLKETIFLTENELLEKNIKKNLENIKINKMPSLHNLSKFKKIKKINKTNFTILCPGIYREEKYGKNLINFLESNLNNNFRLKISKKFKVKLKNTYYSLNKKIIFVDNNLNYKNFIKEVQKSDVIFLPYKMPAYKYRTSGLFFESISLNKFTFVSNGTLMENDLKKFNLQSFAVKKWKDLKINRILNIIENKKNINNLRNFSDYYKKVNGPKSFSNKLNNLCEKF